MDIKIEKIIRTKRKTIALEVTDNATLIVRAPYRVSESTIQAVIRKHYDWIIKKKNKNEVEARDPKVSAKEFVNGESFLYLGKYYKLQIVEGQEEPLKFENAFYLSKEALPYAEKAFAQWYKKAALEKITERVQFYAKVGGYKYSRINITSAQRRWGSCSCKGNLNFSWRLIMAPLPVVDYVVVHELAHLEEKNHGRGFWAKVKILMPDYQKHKSWLKNNRHMLKL